MAKLQCATFAFSMTLLIGVPPLAHAADILDLSGFGRVKFGMTTKQAERALGAKLKLTSDEDPSGHCLRGSRADGLDPGVTYMALKGVIQRIDVELALEPAVVTPEGIGHGATPIEVQSIYGVGAKRDVSDPNADPASNQDLVVDNPNHRSGILFAFDGGKLTWLIAGNYPALSFYEGCL